MRVRLLIVLAVVGFASPWVMVASQMQHAAPLTSTSEAQNRE